MYKKLFIISIIMWSLTLGTLTFMFVKGDTTKSSDNRQAVLLAPPERDIVLGEMRLVLKALNGTLRAIGKNDFKEASIAAGSAGAGMAVDINPVLMAKLPLEFKKLGLSMHDDFDTLSKDIKSGLNQTETIKRLGDITNKCIACHSTYRLQDVPEKK